VDTSIVLGISIVILAEIFLSPPKESLINVIMINSLDSVLDVSFYDAEVLWAGIGRRVLNSLDSE
jgi:hypothetical protein